jgi:adenosine deaminase
MGLPLDDIKDLVLSGFKSAFLPFHIKQGMLRKYVPELARFHADGTIAPPISQPPNTPGHTPLPAYVAPFPPS